MEFFAVLSVLFIVLVFAFMGVSSDAIKSKEDGSPYRRINIKRDVTGYELMLLGYRDGWLINPEYFSEEELALIERHLEK